MTKANFRVGLLGGAFAVAVLAAPAPASACEGHGDKAAWAQKKEERFKKADANSDGFLTADEVGADKWARIQVADANGDGKVSFEELKQAHADGKIQHKGKGKKGKKGKKSPTA